MLITIVVKIFNYIYNNGFQINYHTIYDILFRMSTEQEHHHEEDHSDDVNVNYVPPPQKTIEELVAADQEDESLRKYKETLLGNAITENIVIGM